MGGHVPAIWPEWLRALFPLEFIGISRTLTLVSGFALILAAIHLSARRRRAWTLSVFLAAACVIFHLTKGWDVKEALCSFGIVVVLWNSRSDFTIGAGRPQLISAAFRAAVALAVAGIYGAVGLWLLEPAEFHHNFHWWDAALRTVRLMLFLGNETLIPRTPHAVWFLDSLFWLFAAAFLYSGFVLFRPVVYSFRIDSNESDLARRIAARYGRTAQDYFKQWPDKSYFFSSTCQSFLAYRVAGSFAIVLGDPVGLPEELERTIREFVDYCERRGWRLGFHQVGHECLRIYKALGFRKLRIGDDAMVDLTRFSLSGSAMKEFRNTVNRLERLGYRVERFEPELPDSLLAELERVSDMWLQLPGNREREFSLGSFERWYLRSTTVYAAFDASGQMAAFANLVPSYQSGLATVDLMRRTGDDVNGTMDFLFAKMFLDLEQRGFRRFSLGMAPLSTPDGIEEHIVHWLITRIPWLFRAESLRRFKAKYANDWAPRYAIYRSRLDLPRLALALRHVTEHPVSLRGAA
jgi:phosphatidylglycerol lysyltransferase